MGTVVEIGYLGILQDREMDGDFALYSVRLHTPSNDIAEEIFASDTSLWLSPDGALMKRVVLLEARLGVPVSSVELDAVRHHQGDAVVEPMVHVHVDEAGGEYGSACVTVDLPYDPVLLETIRAQKQQPTDADAVV